VSQSVGTTQNTLEVLSTVGQLSKVGTQVIPGLSLVGDVISGGLAGRDLVKQVRRQQGLGKLEMSTSNGERWKTGLDKRFETKKRLSGFQMTLAGLGIAGTLVGLLSNPVGWAIGAVALLGGGGLAMYQLGKKMSNKHKTVELTKQKRLVDRAFPDTGKDDKDLSQVVSLSQMSDLITNHLTLDNGKQRRIETDGTLVDDDEQSMDDVLKMLERGGKDRGGKTSRKDRGTTDFSHLYESTEPETEEPPTFKEWLGGKKDEFDEGLYGTSDTSDTSGTTTGTTGTTTEDRPKIDKKTRKELKKEADEVQRMVSEMAALAGELRDALLEGGKVFQSEHQAWINATVRASKMTYGTPPTVELSDRAKQYQDVMALIEVLDVSYEEVVSDSGQQLLERKLALR
jgi:hypothetical protein